MSDRFWSKTELRPNGCIEWIAGKDSNGYGIYWYNGKNVKSHRYAKGNLNNSLFVCHKCDNPSCVNPDHLFVGTATDNNQDCKLKGRHKNQWTNNPVLKRIRKVNNKDKTVCKNGHIYSIENTHYELKSNGLFSRRCKICRGMK